MKFIAARRAFAKTLKDPNFVEETNKADLEINPLTGEEVAKHVRRDV